MNKKLVKVLALSLAAMSVTSMTACGGKEVYGGAEALQMCVSDFGYGVEWAYQLIDAFKNEAWVQEKYPNLAIPEPTITTERTFPVTDIESTYATHDLYFSCDYATKPMDGCYADLTDMYNTTIPGENVTVKGKMYAQFVEEADRDLGEGFSAMDFPWVNGSYGLMYNKLSVKQAFGENYEMPVTTYELSKMGDEWKKKYNKKGDPKLIMIANKQPGWSEGAFRVMWGQYAGEEGYRSFMSGQVDGEYSVEVFKDTARFRSLQTIERLIGAKYYASINTDYAEDDYTTTQAQYLAGDACFMFMGDWFELEMEDFMSDPDNQEYLNPENDFYFLKTPVNSSIVEKMSFYTHKGTDYYDLDASAMETYNTKLSVIVKAVDEGKTELAGVSKEDFAIVKEARTCKSTLGGHVAFVPENSDAKDLAKDFLIFMASDKGIETFMKATKGCSTAFKYEMDYNSDLFKGFSPLQQQRLKDTSLEDWYVGKGYRTALTRKGGLTDVCTQQGQKHLEIEFCSQSSSDRRTAEAIRDGIYNKFAANNNAVWNDMLFRAGIID